MFEAMLLINQNLKLPDITMFEITDYKFSMPKFAKSNKSIIKK